VISDSLGETAEFVAKAAASQFNSGQVEIKRIPYVNDEEHIAEILAEMAGQNAMIAFTLVLPRLRQCLLDKAREYNILAVDVLGPMLDAFSRLSQTPPRLEPGLLHKLDEDYFSRVEAIEFAVKYDDGKDPRGILYADIVLIGISRTSKTPLCMYLAHKRIRAANVPLVPEVSPPEELFSIPPRKIVGLTVKPEILNPIRQERLKSLGLAPSADYASMERILKEIEYAEKIMSKIGCPVIDVSNKAVEETASRILQIYYRGEQSERK
jgi:regulator of PEP synthase PpsR (kinase-PPPase family)